jgi:hypothetical protein
MRKTESGVSYSISIPQEYVDTMRWKKGDRLLFSKLDKKSLKLEKI